LKNKAILEKGLAEFVRRFESETDQIKKQVHFNSVQNITNGLIKIWNKPECEKLISQLQEYFREIKSMNYPIDKIISASQYKNYIYPAGSYLIFNKSFITKASFKAFIIWGLIFDIVFYFISNMYLNFYFPFFTPLFTLLGWLKQRKAIKEKRIFGIFW
tara:strand:- start:33205 stop:33681 length:477 start_codon:yes stop_codon:yes gene_type:complete